MALELKDLSVGQDVFCFSFGSWYPGKVTKLARTRATVAYATGSGKEYTKSFGMNKVSLEKPENSGRSATAAAKKKKRLAEMEKMDGQPVMEQGPDGLREIPNSEWAMEDGQLVAMRTTQLELSQVDSVRLLCAFQVLFMPSGLHGRTVMHTRARQIILEMTGIRLRVGAKPPHAGMDIPEYIEWASNPELQLVPESGPEQEQVT